MGIASMTTPEWIWGALLNGYCFYVFYLFGPEHKVGHVGGANKGFLPRRGVFKPPRRRFPPHPVRGAGRHEAQHNPHGLARHLEAGQRPTVMEEFHRYWAWDPSNMNRVHLKVERRINRKSIENSIQIDLENALEVLIHLLHICIATYFCWNCNNLCVTALVGSMAGCCVALYRAQCHSNQSAGF